MAFKDFKYRVHINNYSYSKCHEWAESNVKKGHWAAMPGFYATTYCYCFEYGDDALAFKLRWSHDISTNI